MTLGLLDLSIVTDRLLKQLRLAKDTSRLWTEEPPLPPGTPVDPQDTDPTVPFDVNFTGLPPDAAKELPGCQLSLYLFHVTPDKTYRNTFPSGGRARTIPEQPLALTLYYLLSAHSESYIEAQQAMSIALKSMHDHPITTAVAALGDRVEEFTVTMEPQSVDDIGRLWLAFATPLRLSAVYRASVIFLEPEEPVAPRPGIVLRPVIDVETLVGGPVPTVAGATVDAAGLVTLTAGGPWPAGKGFDSPTLRVQIGGLVFERVLAAPPAAGQLYTPTPPTSVELQLPHGTPHGRYLMRVQLTPETAIAEVWITVPVDVP